MKRGTLLAALVFCALGAGCGARASARAVADPARPQRSPRGEGTAAVEKAGVYHVLRSGQTLFALSRAYRVPVDELEEANRITDPSTIPAGTPIFVPGASHLLQVPVPGGPVLAWPLEGPITTPFVAEPEGEKARHDGIDIDGVLGEEVHAAAAGRVIWAGTERRYGRMLVIEHGAGLTTLYAHASELLVQTGDEVQEGLPIARVGRSGNARGTHLHFEVRREGVPVDPLPLLPPPTSHLASAP
jgi:lipoprotein NlpD